MDAAPSKLPRFNDQRKAGLRMGAVRWSALGQKRRDVGAWLASALASKTDIVAMCVPRPFCAGSGPTGAL